MDIAELSMILETLGPRVVTSDEMNDAINKVKQLNNKLTNEQQLLLYGLYKQYLVGDINITNDNKNDIVATKKWEAWKSFEGFPKNNAALAYVYIVGQLLCAPDNEITINSLEKDGSTNIDGFGAIVSTLNVEYGGSMQWSSKEAVFEAVVENNIDKLLQCIENGDDIHARDDEGMTPLHFAADRGNTEIATILLDNGVDINALDDTKQTPIMYAVSCEHKDMVELLVLKGADLTVKNDDGETVKDFDDIPTDILTILS